MKLRAFQLVVLVVLLMVPGGHARADLTPEQTQQAETLIAQFRAPEFAVRQQAVKALVAMGLDVLPLVRKTLAETKDAEVKLRCRMVIKGILSLPISFESLTVNMRGSDGYDRTITIKADGSYEFDMVVWEREGKKKFHANYRLRPEHLRELDALIIATKWLTKPGAFNNPYMKDGTKYRIAVTRAGKTSEAVCYGKQQKEYAELIRFLLRINHQESLLYQATVVHVGRLRAARALSSELDAIQGKPHTRIPYAPVLDYNRLVPTFTETVAKPHGCHDDVVVAGIRLLGYPRIESERKNITALANDRSLSVRKAVAYALCRLGGPESIVELRRMLSTTRAAAWSLIRLGPEAVPTILEVIEESTDAKATHQERMRSEYIIRSYVEHWNAVPKPIDPRVVAATRKSMAAPKVKEFRTEYHQKLLDLAAGKKLETYAELRKRIGITWHGLKVSDAPSTRDQSKLPDLFVERPAGSGTWVLRGDVKELYRSKIKEGVGHVRVYDLPKKQLFYVRVHGDVSNIPTYYGSFKGDPRKVLGLDDKE